MNVGPWHEQFPRLGLIVAEVGRAYAVKDLHAAAAWADSLPANPGGCRANAIDGVAAGWAQKGPQAALQFYTAAEKSGAGATARGPIAARGPPTRPSPGTWPKATLQSALKLVSASESLVLKSHVIHDVAVELSRRDPAAAAEVVQHWAGLVDYYGYRSGAAAVVAAAWAAKEPRPAAAWAAKLDTDRDRAAALRAVAATWAKHSPPEALAWAKAIEDPHDALYALVGVAAGADK